MEAYLIDWISLIFRWVHVITGIAWIGASFYFIWLDNHLQEPPEWKKNKGIKGDLWAIHGGGIYEVAKYKLSPESMPETLHWFKWEAYSTWLTGMVLLSVIYYLGAESYLIDREVADLTQLEAIALGLGLIFSSYIFYERLCKSRLRNNTFLIAVILSIVGVFLVYLLTNLFSGRGAFIHFGAIIGTLMVGNVFRVIIPSQRALVSAIESGSEPDPEWGLRAKLHSTHNTYLTLPLIFIMISAHYPHTYAHSLNWLILLIVCVTTAFVRHYFVLRHKQVNKPQIIAVSLLVIFALAYYLMPPRIEVGELTVSERGVLNGQVEMIVLDRCGSCHSANPTDEVFTMAPGGVMLDNLEQIRQWSGRIKARSVDTKDMPFLNKTGMLDEERVLLGQWIALDDLDR